MYKKNKNKQEVCIEKLIAKKTILHILYTPEILPLNKNKYMKKYF